MKKLIQIELHKITSYNTFKILGGLYVGLFLLVIIILPQIELRMNFQQDVDLLEIRAFYSFPVIFNTYAWIASWFNVFLAILVIFLVGNEYSFRTFRQHAIDGLSRSELIFGKFLILIIIAFVNLLIVFLSSIIMGLIYSVEYTAADVFSHLPILLVYFVQAVAYMSFAMFIAVWLRNKTLSIVVFLVYSLMIEPILRLVIKKYVLEEMILYFPVKVIFRLTPIPENALVHFVKTNAQASGVIQEGLPVYMNVGLAMIYTMIFYLISRQILRKRNL